MGINEKVFEGGHEWCIECGEAWPIYGEVFSKCYDCATEEEIREYMRRSSIEIEKLESQLFLWRYS